jgi:small subunit ribosomal protein S21
MIIINIKDGESLDKALKRFKKKFEKTGVSSGIREKSVARRTLVKHAIYKENMHLEGKI